MPNDYQDSSVVVPVFTGINDAPTVPTASQAGNGSDIIARINNLLTFLDTDIPDLDSRIETLELAQPSAPTQSFILDVSNRNNFDDFFNSGNSIVGTPILQLIYFPEIFPFYYYDNNSASVKSIDFANVYTVQEFGGTGQNPKAIFVADVDGVNEIDLSLFFSSNGRGYYLFIPYDVDSGGYSSNLYLPTQGVEITINSSKGNVHVVTLIGNFSYVLAGGQFKDSNASNSPSNADKIQMLFLEDASNFDVNITLNNDN